MKLNEKKKSVEELYKALFSMREALQEALSLAQETVNISQQFGGEIPRVVTDQINTYFLPVISKFIDDEDTPGAITPLVAFLDSVPLAMTREEPKPEEIAPSSSVSEDNIAAPPVDEDSAPVVENPAEGSYAAQVQEKTLRESGTYTVRVGANWSTGRRPNFSYKNVGIFLAQSPESLYNYIKSHKEEFTSYIKAKRANGKGVLQKKDNYDFTQKIRPEDIREEEIRVNPDAKVFTDKGMMTAKQYTATSMSESKNIGTKSIQEKVIDVTDEDIQDAIEGYRDHGFTDEEIMKAVPRDLGVSKDNVSKFLESPRKVSKAYLNDDNLEESKYRKGRVKEAEEKSSDEEIAPTEGKFFIKRKSNASSTLGKLGNIKDEIVSTFDNKEDADNYAETLNSTIPVEEKELTGVEYSVEAAKSEKKKEPEGASKKVKEANNSQVFKITSIDMMSNVQDLTQRYLSEILRDAGIGGSAKIIDSDDGDLNSIIIKVVGAVLDHRDIENMVDEFSYRDLDIEPLSGNFDLTERVKEAKIKEGLLGAEMHVSVKRYDDTNEDQVSEDEIIDVVENIPNSGILVTRDRVEYLDNIPYSICTFELDSTHDVFPEIKELELYFDEADLILNVLD